MFDVLQKMFDEHFWGIASLDALLYLSTCVILVWGHSSLQNPRSMTSTCVVQ